MDQTVDLSGTFIFCQILASRYFSTISKTKEQVQDSFLKGFEGKKDHIASSSCLHGLPSLAILSKIKKRKKKLSELQQENKALEYQFKKKLYY